MDTRNPWQYTRPIMTNRLCLGVLASVLVMVGGDPARAASIVVDGLQVSANNGQTQAQQAQDRYECHSWASGQTGFDPTQSGGGVTPDQNAAKSAIVTTTITTCLYCKVTSYDPPGVR